MIIAYILIKARHGKLRICEVALKNHEEVEELHEVLGEWDIIAKVAVPDLASLKEFIQNKLQITEGIKETTTLLCNDTSEFE
ncbi:Lrp/AsnC family transcriptional regulator [Candidatus Woesearchaeota archaeon]|nr:MAG: Lrp/AsnC family transcriptional regulator [Candidatus Woesearchaeota archaeon]